MRYRVTMRFYQWVIGRRVRVPALDRFLVRQINGMQRRHREAGKWKPKPNKRMYG